MWHAFFKFMPYELHLQFFFLLRCVLSVVCVCECICVCCCCCKYRDNECKMRDGASFLWCAPQIIIGAANGLKGSAEKGAGYMSVCVCVLRLIKNNSSSSASLVISRSPWQLLCSALTFPFFLSLSLCLASLLLLLQWATLFSSPHTRHKSMFDFHNNNNSISRREIRKAMRKKKTKRETARRSRQGHGRRDTGYGRQDAGHYVRAMFKISASCLCYFYSIHFFFSVFLRCFSSHALHIFLLFPCGKWNALNFVTCGAPRRGR